MQRGLQFFAGSEVVALEDFLYSSIEAFNHAVGLGGFRWRQTMFDVQIVAEPVKLVPAGRAALAQTKEAIGELFAVISQDRADADRTSSFKVS